MDMDNMRQMIAEKRANGETYEKIGEYFHIDRAMIKHIESHNAYQPSEKMIKKLGIERPVTPKIIRDRARRKAQKDELTKLRKENYILKDALISHLQKDCKCAFCEAARKALVEEL